MKWACENCIAATKQSKTSIFFITLPFEMQGIIVDKIPFAQ